MQVFTPDEIARLAEALETGEGREVSPEEVDAFLNWASRARLDSFLVDEALGGSFDACRQGTTYAFKLSAIAMSRIADRALLET